MMNLLPLLLALMMVIAPSYAAEEKKAEETPVAVEKPAEEAKTEEPVAVPAENPGRYSPDHCDFEITFPEKPYLAQKCLPDGKTCYNLYSYTMVYDLRTTVDVSVTCNKSTPADFKRYNEAVMKAALQGMISERRLDTHDIEYRDGKDVRSASLSGTGITGTQQKIYTAQIWVGQKSVFTVQAELIGAEHDQADAVFSEILKSVKVKDVKKEAPKAEPKKED